MKKTIQVNLSGQVFTLDEDAYDLLTQYLASIARLYERSAGKDEIIQDIESRIAELFLEKLTDLKGVIDSADVEQIISVLGKPEEFEGDAETSDYQYSAGSSSKERQRSLFRDPEDRILGGVCSGIGHYFGVSPVWLRLAFAAALLFFGTGAMLYIILWVIIPVAGSTSERLKMKGEPVNIGSIGKVIEEELSALSDAMKPGQKGDRYARNATNAAERFFRFIFRLVVFLLRFVGKVIGAIFSFLGVVFIIALIAVLAGAADAFHFSHDMWSASYSIYEMGDLLFESTLWISLALVAGSIIALCPFLLLLYVGVRLLRRDFRIPYFSGSIFGLWLIGIGLGVFVAISTAQDFSKTETIRSSIPLDQLGVTADTIHIELADDPFNVPPSRSYGANRDFMMKEDGNRVVLSYVQVSVVPAKDNEARITILRSANGSHFNEANRRADSIRYLFQHSEESLKFNAYLSFPESDRLRAQEVFARVELPIGRTVYLSASSKRVIYDIENVHNMYDLDMIDHHWMMTTRGLECLDCEGITPPKLKSRSLESDSTSTASTLVI